MTKNTNDGVVSTNDRLYLLLSLVGHESCLLRGDEDIEKTVSMDIDYSVVHARLAELREFTKNFIKDTLTKSGIKYDKDFR